MYISSLLKFYWRLADISLLFNMTLLWSAWHGSLFAIQMANWRAHGTCRYKVLGSVFSNFMTGFRQKKIIVDTKILANVNTVFPLVSTGPQISAVIYKRRTFGYPHWNKHLPLISASLLISTSPLNVALIRTALHSTSS